MAKKKMVRLTEEQFYKAVSRMVLEYIGDNGMLGKQYLDDIEDEDAELSKYGKEIIEIDSLETYGENIANLMSMNYVKKVLDVLKGGSYRKVA
jgi:hypothetical protein